MYKLEGFDELKKAFDSLGSDALAVMQTRANNAGKIVLDKTISKAKGNLKNGYELRKAALSKTTIYSQVIIKKGYAYAVPYELGHDLTAWGHKTDKYIKGRPTMRTAADESEDEVDQEFLAGLDEILQRFGD